MKKSIGCVIGQVVALTLAIEVMVFGISLVLEILFSTEFAKNLGYISSLLIAISVVILMVCFHDSISEPLKVFGLLALVASILYAPLCISTYFIQLTVVAFNPLNLSNDVMNAITFKPGSLTFAIDMLGYGFLCLSTLAAGFALVRVQDKVLRALCFFHGALAVPTFASPIISGLFLTSSGETDFTGHYVLLFWCAVFIPIALLFIKYYKEKQMLLV